MNQDRNPVLLVHGISDTGAVFHKMRPYLQERGWSVYDLDLVPNNGDVGLEELAQQVANHIAATFHPTQALDLIGFSMGGIVSRYYIQRLGGINHVQRFITIASPHHGTWVAYGSLRPGGMQMRPNSPFLNDLNGDVEMLKNLQFTSIWTPYDLMIVPPRSSQMPLGREVIVPALAHPLMLTDIRSLAAVAQALSEPVKPYRQFEQIQKSQKLPTGNGNI